MTPPLVTLVVPVLHPHPDQLRATLASIMTQDAGFELMLVDVGSTDPAVRDQLTSAAADRRVTVLHALTGSPGIVALANLAINRATGTFVGFVDTGDTLTPGALRSIAELITARPDLQLIYTDEAGPAGDFRKPDFSPERLRNQPYLGALTLYRATLLQQIGGVRHEFDGAHSYDLSLRITERAGEIGHIAEVLYTRQAPPRVLPADPAPAVRAVTEHLQRAGVAGTVETSAVPEVYRIRRELATFPLVSVVIPTRGSSAMVNGATRCLVVEAVRSVVETSTYPNLEIIVVLDADAPAEVAPQLAEIAGDRVRVVPWTAEFNFSAKINRGVLWAAGEFVVLLNDDVEVITPDWLEAMVGLALPADVGLVGPMLYFEDGSIQQAGHAVHHGGPGHIGYRAAHGSPGPQSAFLVDREVNGVTAACALVRRSVFLELGGLTLDLPINFNDVDFAQKLRAAGYRMLWTPHAELYHFESKTRFATVASYEINTLNDRWGRVLIVDPFWHHVEPAPDQDL